MRNVRRDDYRGYRIEAVQAAVSGNWRVVIYPAQICLPCIEPHAGRRFATAAEALAGGRLMVDGLLGA